jgi:hypothetical protein
MLMYEGWATSSPCTVTITDLLCFIICLNVQLYMQVIILVFQEVFIFSQKGLHVYKQLLYSFVFKMFILLCVYCLSVDTGRTGVWGQIQISC